ncbi:gliding motility-associated C-terminal domain-containing protein [Spirosoma fluminis]
MCTIGRPVFAQTCPSLSAALTINQSFGRGNTKPSLTGLTSYQYVSANCPEDGEYTVASAVDGSCFGFLWHNLPEDHTPNDVDGNMLIINGSRESGEFYRQPIIGLCPGTTYEFSVWGVNLLKKGVCTYPLIPKLSISIETVSGQVLQTIDIGSIPETDAPQWRQFATLFTAPITTEEVVVKLINKQGDGGCGNDLALDDFQLKQCEVCPPTPVYVPDAFTPNSDGINDDLVVRLGGAVSFNLKVFDRWGNVVFNSDALTTHWNGTYAGMPCPTGKYSWAITYQLSDPSNVVKQYVQTGTVMLLR